MTTLFFDIETIGTTDPVVIDEIAENIKPPGNISKPETIAKWVIESKQKAIDDAVARTSFDGGVGQIICIGFAIDGEPVQSISSGSESGIIKDFFVAVDDARELHYSGGIADNPPLFVGHNIIGFDLRFLWQRCVVLGIKPPDCMPFDRRQQQRGCYDTMVAWNPDRDKRTSLDSLCRRLRVPSSKADMDGSQVWDFFKTGRIAEITSYCRQDVDATRECYRRMVFC